MSVSPRFVVRLTATALASLLVSVACTAAPPSTSPHSAGSTTPPVKSRGTYLIVYASHLAEAAARWAEYRAAGGWQVRQLPVKPSGDPETVRAALQARIRKMAANHRRWDRFAVLLLGDAGREGIPTWRIAQTDSSLLSRKDPLYATDHPYQLSSDSDDQPSIILGRVPARTVAEADTVLAKIRRYEENEELGPWRRRIAYTAGEGRFGVADRLLELLFKTMVDRMVPEAFDISMTYAKGSSIYCPPPSELTETVLSQLDEGALLFNYIGHGTATRLDRLRWAGKRLPILGVDDLARLSGSHGQHPIAVLTCCSAGFYDLPGDTRCLAEAMLINPAGPVAVIAGSRPTHPYANIILQKDITRLLLIEGVGTVGELDLLAMRSMLQIDEDDRRLDTIVGPIAALAKWPSSLRQLRRMHVKLYNLLGDPALKIALPRGRIEGFALQGDRITGRVKGMAGGRVLITLETRRTSPARSDGLIGLDGDDDPDLEAKARNNYPIANDLVLLRLEGRINDGRFSVQLPDRLPSNAAVIKAYASGRDDSGRPLDAITALRLKLALSLR